MLVLSRKADERIQIGDSIVLVVHRIAGNRVVLGIDAPPEVQIRRCELAPLESVSARAGSGARARQVA